jgi:hypothetical protein
MQIVSEVSESNERESSILLNSNDRGELLKSLLLDGSQQSIPGARNDA